MTFTWHHYYEVHDNVPYGCEKETLHYYFFAYLALLFLSTLNDAVVAGISSRGSIFDKERRKCISKFLYVRAFILTLEAATGIFGCYIVFDKQKQCFTGSTQTLSKFATLFNIFWVFGCLVIMWITFDSAGSIFYALERKSINKTPKKYRSIDTLDFEEIITKKNEKYWNRTCKLMFCCTKTESSRDNVLLFASKIFTKYFRTYHDLVPSDILAGMVLLRQRQKFEECKRVEKELESCPSSSYKQVIQ